MKKKKQKKEVMNMNKTGKHLAYNNAENDVVLTPDYLINDLMLPLLRADKGDKILDPTCGTGNMLAAIQTGGYKAMGIEIMPGLCEMSKENAPGAEVINGDALTTNTGEIEGIIANPPYSLPAAGLNIIAERMKELKDGKRAVVLIQENAGRKSEYLDSIMSMATLEAVIKMSPRLFVQYASVQTAIYVFRKGKAHRKDDVVKFIDFAKDGYRRSGRKTKKANVSLKDDGTAKKRYAALVKWITEDDASEISQLYGGSEYFERSLKSENITFAENREIDTRPTKEDFEKTVADYMAWKVSEILHGREV